MSITINHKPGQTLAFQKLPYLLFVLSDYFDFYFHLLIQYTLFSLSGQWIGYNT